MIFSVKITENLEKFINIGEIWTTIAKGKFDFDTETAFAKMFAEF